MDERLNKDRVGKIISIIIPCYNSEEFLDDCFISIQKQTLGMDKLEVIFINDASTDDTLNKLLGYETNFPESIIIIDSAVNTQQGGARNLGLHYATGTYIMFVDSDDWIKPEMCEALYQIAQEYDADIIAYPFVHYYSETEQETEKSLRYGFLAVENVQTKRQLLILGDYMDFGSQNKFYKHSLIKEVEAKFVEHAAYEEASFAYPLIVAARKVYWMEEGMYYYRRTRASVTSSYVSQPGKLYDHPKVQLVLLDKLLKDKKAVNAFYNEIEYHFLHSYYMETLYFAGLHSWYFGIDYFEEMQKTVLERCPNWEQNPYLKQKEFCNVAEVLKSVRKKFNQQELADYCKRVVEILSN
ncbi:glycosyltransferase [Lachnospiraceae bacterium ZAX-1]